MSLDCIYNHKGFQILESVGNFQDNNLSRVLALYLIGSWAIRSVAPNKMT